MADDKIFKLQGKTLEELKAMKIEELALIFSAENRRKIKRGFTEQERKLLEKFRAHDDKIKTHERNMIVLPEMVGTKIAIHKGKEFVEVTIEPDMIGHRFGELAPTRKIGVQHAVGGSGDDEKDKEKKSEDKKGDKE